MWKQPSNNKKPAMAMLVAACCTFLLPPVVDHNEAVFAYNLQNLAGMTQLEQVLTDREEENLSPGTGNSIAPRSRM